MVEQVVKGTVVAIAVLIMGLYVWGVNQPDPATQKFIDDLERIK